MAISNKKAVEAAKTLVDYCREQGACQNCIFRKHGGTKFEREYLAALELAKIVLEVE